MLVKNGAVIGWGHNRRVQENDPVLQFGIPKVIAGESENFSGARDLLEQHGVEVIDLNLKECIAMMRDFIAANPLL